MSSKHTTSIFKARRSEYTDIPIFQTLLTEENNKVTFQDQKLDQLLEHSLLSVTVLVQTKRFEHVVGYASFNDVPTRLLPYAANWADLLQQSLPDSYFSPTNAFFLTSLISEPRTTQSVLHEALKVLFTVVPELDYCLLLTIGQPDTLYDKCFPAWMEFVTEGTGNVVLSVCKKNYIYPDLVVRKAEVADVPRVLPYFGRLHDKFKVELAEDWLEKVVMNSQSSDDTRCCIVEDEDGKVCGFFSVTSAHVDWDFLDDHYQTTIFHQFLKVRDEERAVFHQSHGDAGDEGNKPKKDLDNGVSDVTPGAENGFDANRQKRKSTKKSTTPPDESGRKTVDSFGSDRSSVERLVKHLMNDLEAIRVTDSGTIRSASLAVPHDRLGGSLDARQSDLSHFSQFSLMPVDSIDDLINGTSSRRSSAAMFLQNARSFVSDLYAPIGGFASGRESPFSDRRDSPNIPAILLQRRSGSLDGSSLNFNLIDKKRSLVNGFLENLDVSLRRVSETYKSERDLSEADFHTAVRDLVDTLEANSVKIIELHETQPLGPSRLSVVSDATRASIERLIDELEFVAAKGGVVDDAKPEPLRPETVGTLQALIDALSEGHAEVSEDEEAFCKMMLSIKPRHFKLTQEPIEVRMESTTRLPGDFQLYRTNIEGLCGGSDHSMDSEACPISPSLVDDPIADDNQTRQNDSKTSVLRKKPSTTARMSELAFRMDDTMANLNFGITKSVNENDPRADEETGPVPRKKPPPPVETMGPDQLLERELREEYGLQAVATEPMFGSFDDLVQVPLPDIASLQQDPRTRKYQKRNDKFFQNPIIGRAHEFTYMPGGDEKNAMYLLLFHLDPLYSTHLDHVLTQCFRVLPGYDYLITEIPTASHSNLLLHKMVRVAMREGHFLHENLYALHRIALFRHDDVELTPGSAADIPAIQHFLEGKANHKALLEAFVDSTHYHTNRQASQLLTVVFRIAGAIIGFVIFSQETNLDYIQAHYNIDDFMYVAQHREQGHLRIHHYVINPLLNSFNQLILKELLRIHNASGYFYRFYPLDQQEERNDSFLCCLENLQLVRPRCPVLKFNDTGDESDWRMLPTAQARDVQPPYALFHTNRRLLFDLREAILGRIVIIGASDTSLQVLRNLSLFPHVRFTNILLIDPHGVPVIDFLDKVDASGFRSARELFTARELCQLAIPTQCQIVYGRAVTMDKENRLLHVNAKTRIPFDWMVIGTGTQFLSFNINVDTDYISALLNDATSNKPLRKMQIKSSLNNYFVMNNSFEVDVVVKDIQALMKDGGSKGYFVVYGNALEAYGCVASLLKQGVAPEEILFVNPAAAYPESATVFSSMDLESWVKSEMFSQGAVVIMEWIAVAYNEGRDGDVIETVTFWTDEATFKTYEVQAFFNYSDRQMNPYTQSFLNSAHLVLDRKLVVDEQFYAYRPRIMAAGSWCKFSRKHFVSNFDFNDVNSRELGDAVSMELLKNLCPDMFLLDSKKPEEDSAADNEKTVYPRLPQFQKPVVDNIELPFGWYYCNIRSPPNPVAGTGTLTSNSEPDKRSKLRMDERRLISTGCISDGNLCEIYLDKLYLIDQIVCVTQFVPPIETLKTIHGMHEGWFELVKRFEDGYISDFFEYFQELWLSCVLYDRFSALGGELRRLLLDDRGDGNNISILQLVSQSFQNQEMAHTPNNQILEEITRRLRVTGINMDIEKTVENFLECNSRHLPMYAGKDNVGEQLNKF